MLVCRGPDCVSRGGHEVYTAVAGEAHRRGLTEEHLVQTASGCVAPLCGDGPVVCAYPAGVWYAGVDTDDVAEILDAVAHGGVVERLAARRVRGAA